MSKSIKPKETTITTALVAAGNALGSYTTSDLGARTTCAQVMEVALHSAIKAGLTVEMLKAGQQAYASLVDAIQSVRATHKVAALADSARDNYISRIRSFVKDPTKPLDIFGNLRAAAMAVANGANPRAKGSKKNSPVTIVKTAEIKGAAPLGMFLAAWIETNEGNTGLLQLRKVAQDLLTLVNVATGAKK